MIRMTLALISLFLLTSCSKCQTDEEKDSLWNSIHSYCEDVDMENINGESGLSVEIENDEKLPIGYKTYKQKDKELKCISMIKNQKEQDDAPCYIGDEFP